MKTNKRRKSGGKHELWKIPKDLMGYVQDGQTETKGFKQANKATRLARFVARRLRYYLVRYMPLHELDSILAERVGKPHSRTAQMRKNVKLYNKGYQAGKASNERN